MGYIGTVLKVRKNNAIVLTEQMHYMKIKTKPGLTVGQEIWFDEKDIINPYSSYVKYASSFAAGIAALLVFAFIYMNINISSQTFAFLSIDINPSIEVSINQNGKVIEVIAKNSDGETIIKTLKLNKKPVDEALKIILKKSNDLGFIENENKNIVLVSAALSDKKDSGSKKEKKLESILSSIKKQEKAIIESNASLKVIKVAPEVKEKADKNGISSGRQAVIIKADQQGIKIPVEEIKKIRITEALSKISIKKPSEPDKQTDVDMNVETNKRIIIEEINEISTPTPTKSVVITKEPVSTPQTTIVKSPTPEITKTNIPTSAIRNTPTPTSEVNTTPAITTIIRPTNTPTVKPEPTNTPTRIPTLKPVPTRKPYPTIKPEPTNTPKPTIKPVPTRTPNPKPTPAPTKTPTPTPQPVVPKVELNVSINYTSSNLSRNNVVYSARVYFPVNETGSVDSSKDLISPQLPKTIEFYTGSPYDDSYPNKYVGSAEIINGKAVLVLSQKPGKYSAVAIFVKTKWGNIYSNIERYEVPDILTPTPVPTIKPEPTDTPTPTPSPTSTPSPTPTIKPEPPVVKLMVDVASASADNLSNKNNVKLIADIVLPQSYKETIDSVDNTSTAIRLPSKVDFYIGDPNSKMFPSKYIGSAEIINGKAVLQLFQEPGEYVAGAIYVKTPWGDIRSNIVRYKVPDYTTPVSTPTPTPDIKIEPIYTPSPTKDSGSIENINP